jgi:nucleotidyltransferase substrate binding protein (TIGR01987 family)
MDASDLEKILSQFENALQRFSEALARDINKDSLVLDAAIQRFEFCFELSWKVLRRYLAREGINASTPREVFKEAFKLGWLAEGDALWSRMITDRNLTSHTYNQKTALDLYSRLPGYRKACEGLLELLKKR